MSARVDPQVTAASVSAGLHDKTRKRARQSVGYHQLCGTEHTQHAGIIEGQSASLRSASGGYPQRRQLLWAGNLLSSCSAPLLELAADERRGYLGSNRR